MKNLIILILTVASLFGCNSNNTNIKSGSEQDKQAILKTIEDWDRAWGDKDVELAIKDYSKEIDWTNAFGDRVNSKAELKQLLQTIFAMDFVMTGENNYGKSEIEFVNSNVAIVRSQNIRKNQTWPDGIKMADRYVNHLRVYQNIDGSWKIVSHMISQAHQKGNKESANADAIEILNSYFNGLRTGQISSIPMTEDVSFLGPSVDEIILGKKAVSEHLSNVAKRFVGSEFKIKEHSINGNSAYFYFDIVMNNGELIVPIVDFFELEEGKIKKIRPYFDPRPFIKEFDRRRNKK